jgi:hypothetical protein
MLSAIILFMGLGGAGMVSILIVFSLVITVLGLIDVIKSDFKKNIDKLVWIIVIICFPNLGGILYNLIGRRQKVTY